MPFLEVNVLPGHSEETKARLIAELTQVVHQTLGSPLETIAVLIREQPAANWGRAGKTKPQLDRERAGG